MVLASFGIISGWFGDDFGMVLGSLGWFWHHVGSSWDGFGVVLG